MENSASLFHNEMSYTGAISDSTTGLSYMNARYYNPATGTFTSQDTYYGSAYSPWTQHLYSYTGANPINFTDPTGHYYVKEVGLPYGAGAGAGGGSYSSGLKNVVSSVLIGTYLGLAYNDLMQEKFSGHNRASSNNNTTNNTNSNSSSDGTNTETAENNEAVNPSPEIYSGDEGSSYQDSSSSSPQYEPDGFNSWRNFKKFLGPAGQGYVWHHIVEQCQTNPSRSGFANWAVQNISNIIRIEQTVHSQISRFYSSIPAGNVTNGLTVRNYLTGLSFQEQYQYGLEILRKFGVLE